MIHVLITGASSGLGSSLYSALHSEKISTTVIGRRPPEDLRVQDDFILMDLSNEVQFSYTPVKDVFRVVFLSNAGVIEPIGMAETVDAKALNASYCTNYLSPFLIAGELARAVRQLDLDLHIVNISSGAANRAIAGWSAYCAGKAAIKIALDCMAAENSRITVQHIDPGVIDTDMQRTIRSSEARLDSNRQYFTTLYREGHLKQPKVAAAEILEKIGGHLK